MDREYILVASLADKEADVFIKKALVQLPCEVFSRSETKKLFLHFKEGRDATDLEPEQINKVAEVLDSPEYKVFAGSERSNKQETLKNLLSQYRTERAIKIFDAFQLKFCNGGDKLDMLTHKLIKDMASLPNIDNTISLEEAMMQSYEEVKKYVEIGQSPIITLKDFPKLNGLFNGGFRKEEIIGILAETGGGKTTLCQNFAYSLYSQGLKVLYLSTEVSEKKLSQKIADVLASRLKINEYYSKVWEEPKKPADLDLIPKVMSYLNSGVTFDIVYTRDITKMVFEMYRKEYDVVFIDHIHDLPGARDSKAEAAIEPLMNACKDWNVNTGGLVFTVLQSRKARTDSEGNKIELTMEDCYGSQAIISNTSSIMSITRKDESDVSVVRNLKSRWGGERGGTVRMNFNEGAFTEK